MHIHKTEEKPKNMGDYRDVVSFFRGKEKEVNSMQKYLQKNKEELIVHVPVEVDHYFADSIREVIDRRVQTEEISRLLFDFSDTKFMDSSGIGPLMGRYKLMKALGGEMYLINENERMKKILMLSGIHKIIPMEGNI